MARQPIIAGNWKMNMTWSGAVRLSQTISDYCTGMYDDIEIILCPPHTCIKGVANVLMFDKSDIEVGAQNVSEFMPEGISAHTGEISVEMLRELGCSYCIIGHSERRAANGETNDIINTKAKLLHANGVTPIICCGESEECFNAGGTVEFITGQIRAALDGLDETQVVKTVLAYEPIWAIGSGRVPTPEDADTNCAAIRGTVEDMYGGECASKVRVLYGGSLKPENAADFLPMPNIDGGLIGGAALDAKKFAELVRICREAKGGIQG